MVALYSSQIGLVLIKIELKVGNIKRKCGEKNVEKYSKSTRTPVKVLVGVRVDPNFPSVGSYTIIFWL